MPLSDWSCLVWQRLYSGWVNRTHPLSPRRLAPAFKSCNSCVKLMIHQQLRRSCRSFMHLSTADWITATVTWWHRGLSSLSFALSIDNQCLTSSYRWNVTLTPVLCAPGFQFGGMQNIRSPRSSASTISSLGLLLTGTQIIQSIHLCSVDTPTLTVLSKRTKKKDRTFASSAICMPSFFCDLTLTVILFKWLLKMHHSCS
jgi:hypothetical protein